MPSYKPTSLLENPKLSLQTVGDRRKLRVFLSLKAEAHLQQFKKSNQLEDLIASYDTYMTLDTLIIQTRQNFKAVGSKYNLQEAIVPIYEEAITVVLQLYDLTNDPTYQEAAHNFISRNKAIILIEGLQDEKLKFKNIPDQLLAEESQLKKKVYELEIDFYRAKQGKDAKKIQDLEDELFENKRSYEKLIQSFEEDYPSYYNAKYKFCLLYTSPSPRDATLSRMPSSA